MEEALHYVNEWAWLCQITFLYQKKREVTRFADPGIEVTGIFTIPFSKERVHGAGVGGGHKTEFPQKLLLPAELVQVGRPPLRPGVNPLLLLGCRKRGLPDEQLEGLSGASAANSNQ